MAECNTQTNFRESDELQKQYQAELEFLQMCLKVNPKSYGTWHHRCFVMDHMPHPDWARELELCNLFLQYDERNCKNPNTDQWKIVI